MYLVLLQSQLPPTNLPYLFAAFAVIWVAFFVYAFFINRRQQELQQQIRLLRQSLEHPDTLEGS
jgi:CcmD family protein